MLEKKELDVTIITNLNTWPRNVDNPKEEKKTQEYYKCSKEEYIAIGYRGL